MQCAICTDDLLYRVAMVRSMLDTLEGSFSTHSVPTSQLLPLMMSDLKGTYKPLLDRPSAGRHVIDS